MKARAATGGASGAKARVGGGYAPLRDEEEEEEEIEAREDQGLDHRSQIGLAARSFVTDEEIERERAALFGDSDWLSEDEGEGEEENNEIANSHSSRNGETTSARLSPNARSSTHRKQLVDTSGFGVAELQSITPEQNLQHNSDSTVYSAGGAVYVRVPHSDIVGSATEGDSGSRRGSISSDGKQPEIADYPRVEELNVDTGDQLVCVKCSCACVGECMYVGFEMAIYTQPHTRVPASDHANTSPRTYMQACRSQCCVSHGMSCRSELAHAHIQAHPPTHPLILTLAFTHTHTQAYIHTHACTTDTARTRPIRGHALHSPGPHRCRNAGFTLHRPHTHTHTHTPTRPHPQPVPNPYAGSRSIPTGPTTAAMLVSRSVFRRNIFAMSFMTFVMECSRGMFIASLYVMVQHSGGDTVMNAMLVSLFRCVFSAHSPSLWLCFSVFCGVFSALLASPFVCRS